MCVRGLRLSVKNPHVVIATNRPLLLSRRFLSLSSSEVQLICDEALRKKNLSYIVLGHHSLIYYPFYPL